MTVNYTTNLALGQPVTGTESGTWGDDVNNSVTSYLDIAIAGGLSVTITTTDVTLTLTQGTSSATNIGSTTAQYAILNISGAMTAARNLILPSSSRQYVINNNTTGGFALTVKGAATTGVTMVNGESAHIYWNGSDYAKLSNAPGGAGTFTNLTYTGTLTGSTGVIAIGTNQIYKDSSGNVGIGTSSPGVKLDVSGVIRSTGTSAILSFSKRSTGTGDAWGMYSQSGEYNIYDYTAGVSRLVIDTSGNVGIGTSSPNLSSSSTALTVNTGTAANYSAFELASGGTLNYHINANNSAVYHVAAGTRPWVVYTGGSERMRIDSTGNVGIGSSTVSGLSLRVSKSLTPGTDSGATDAYGVRVDGSIAATATNSVRLYSTYPSTVASAFTLGTLSHYQANQGTLGAGSAITSQYGFQADSGLVGATTNIGFLANDIGGASATSGKTNIGFYSSLSTASGGGSAWNIYANGTAPSYFAGSMGIGTNSPGAKLDVAGNIRLSAGSPVVQFNNGGPQIYVTAANTLQFSINSGSSEAMRIDSSGNVGIGTSSPSSYGKFAVIGNGTTSSTFSVVATDSAGTSNFTVRDDGLVTANKPAGLGYGTGSGGTVTQATSKSTAVTLNKPTGQITMNAAALLGNTAVVFRLNDSLISSVDTVIYAASGNGNYTITTHAIFAGAVDIRVTNATIGSLSEALVINFSILKGATS